MTLDQAAAYLGVAVITVRRRIADGSLPAYRLGPRLIRVRATDVRALLHGVPTTRSGRRQM